MPILCRALRNRAGHRRHYAIAGMVQHALETGWIKPPFSEAFESPNHVEALIQLAYEANWQARELPLPDHPGPRHPPVYYRIDTASRLPVPTKDSLIRGDYVYTRYGRRRITKAAFIHPWQELDRFPYEDDFVKLGWDTCYRLEFTGRKIEIFIHRISKSESIHTPWIASLDILHFSPYHDS